MQWRWFEVIEIAERNEFDADRDLLGRAYVVGAKLCADSQSVLQNAIDVAAALARCEIAADLVCAAFLAVCLQNDVDRIGDVEANFSPTLVERTLSIMNVIGHRWIDYTIFTDIVEALTTPNQFVKATGDIQSPTHDHVGHS